MSKKELMIIVGLVVGILALFVGSTMEFRKESDLDWRQKFTLDSKDPYGAWMFDQLVKTYYDSNNVVYHYKDTLIGDLDSTGMLYIMFGNIFTFTQEESRQLFDFVKSGNQALVIGKMKWLEDTTSYMSDEGNRYHTDSILNFTFSNDTSGTIYSYEHYNRGLQEKSSLTYGHFGFSNNGYSESLGHIETSIVVYTRTDIGEGSIYQHCVPEFFINHASKQDYYRDYINTILGQFDPTFIVMDHPNFNRFGDRDNADTRSPIQFVLSQKSLKTAYYLILFGSLLFVIFKSKRKQRAIPILEKNRNTTLEYVETLSSLFSSQGQSARLIPHIKNYFYHSVKKKYFLDEKNPNFVKLLSKKSKFDESELQVIVKMLDNSDKGYAYPDDQLINLHRRVENFYKTAK